MNAPQEASWGPLVLAVLGVAVLLALALAPRVLALPVDRPPHQTVPTLTPSGQPASPSPPPPGTQPPPPPTVPPATPVGPTPSPLVTPAGAVFGDLQQTVDRVAARPGEVLTYTLRLANRGEVAAGGLILIDELDPALSLLRVEATQGRAQVDGQRLVLEIGTLLPGGAASVVLRAQVDWQAQAGLVIVNWAQVRWGQAVIHSNETAVALPPAVLPATGAARP